jgi:hypothetical protein
VDSVATADLLYVLAAVAYTVVVAVSVNGRPIIFFIAIYFYFRSIVYRSF